MQRLKGCGRCGISRITVMFTNWQLKQLLVQSFALLSWAFFFPLADIQRPYLQIML